MENNNVIYSTSNVNDKQAIRQDKYLNNWKTEIEHDNLSKFQQFNNNTNINIAPHFLKFFIECFTVSNILRSLFYICIRYVKQLQIRGSTLSLCRSTFPQNNSTTCIVQERSDTHAHLLVLCSQLT